MINESGIVSANDLPGSDTSGMDTEGQQLRDLATKADKGEISQEEIEAGQKPAEVDSATDTQQRAAEQETNKPNDQTDNPEPSAEADKQPEATEEPKSSYQQRKSERDKLLDDQKRLATNWKEFSEGKLKWQEDMRQQMAQLRQELVQRAQPAPAATDSSPRFDSKQFSIAAGEFEKRAVKSMEDGDVDGAKENIRLANESRAYAQKTYQDEATSAQKQFEATWNANADAVIKENPELGQAGSEAHQAMMKLLGQYPILGHVPDGFKVGVEILKMQRDAAEASGLREKLTTTEKQLKELQERTSIKGGSPVSHTETKVEDLPLDQQADVLRRQLVESDMAGAY